MSFFRTKFAIYFNENGAFPRVTSLCYECIKTGDMGLYFCMVLVKGKTENNVIGCNEVLFCFENIN